MQDVIDDDLESYAEKLENRAATYGEDRGEPFRAAADMIRGIVDADQDDPALRLTEKHGRLVVESPYPHVDDMALRVFVEEIDETAIGGTKTNEYTGELEVDDGLAWLIANPRMTGIDDRRFPTISLQPELPERLDP